MMRLSDPAKTVMIRQAVTVPNDRDGESRPGAGGRAHATSDSRRRTVPVPVRLLDLITRVVLVAALAAVLVFTVGQIVDRYIVKSTFDAYDQYARVGLMWLTFIGIAAGVRDRVNIRIDLLNHFAPPRWRNAIGFVLDLGMLAVSVIIVLVGLPLLEVGGFQVIMGTSMTYQTMYTALLSGMGLMIVFLLLRLADRCTGGHFGFCPREDDDDHHP